MATILSEGIDAAARYDLGEYPDLNATLLLDEYLLSVATSEFVQRHPQLLEAALHRQCIAMGRVALTLDHLQQGSGSDRRCAHPRWSETAASRWSARSMAGARVPAIPPAARRVAARAGEV